VCDLTRGQVKAFVLALRDHEPAYASGTLRIAYATLRAVLNAALDDELIGANPSQRLGKLLTRPAAPGDGADVAVKAFDAAQLHTFLETAARMSPLCPLYLAGAHAGLRLGELCGWQLGDLHLEERRAEVKRSLGQECSMRDPKPSSPKTGRERTVDLSAELAAMLEEIKAKRPARAMARGWRPVPPWVFVTGNGTPYSERHVTKNFKRVLTEAKLPEHFTPHSSVTRSRRSTS
jgi:integrase